jgi:hypothetical protein
MTRRCWCGETACSVLSVAPEYHYAACPTCAEEWPLVRSVLEATEGRHWSMSDFRRWQEGRRA